MTATNILSSVLGGGSTGTGSGFALGPLTNTFANVAARNAYATANATWLAQYNANRDFWIKTGVNVQRRNVGGTDWENVTGIITGKNGAVGSQGAQGIYNLEIYIASATVPTLPVGGSLVVATNVFSSPPTGWSVTIPTGVLAADVSIYISRARIDPRTQSGTVVPVWSRPTDIGNPAAVLAEAERAEAAQAAAVVAQTAAEAAQTVAETSKTAAEAAQVASKTSEDAAASTATALKTALITAFQGYIAAGTQSGISLSLSDAGELNVAVHNTTPTHTGHQYLAVKNVNTFLPADFTGTLGVEFSTTSHTVIVPDIGTQNFYFAFARLSTDPAPTFLDVNSTGFNQFGAITKASGTIVIGTGTYDVYISNNDVAQTGDQIEFR